MNEPHTKLLAGAAEIIITPALDGPLNVVRPSTGVHDDLFARALVISDTLKKTAIVSLDLAGVGFAFTDELREQIKQRTGIDTALVNCTHTHSAPFTMPYSVTNWHWLMKEGRPWYDALLANITEVVCWANAELSEATIRIGREPVQIGLNRRADLQKQSDDEKLSLDDGVIPWVDVLRIDGMDGNPIAILFSHAAHPVTVHHASNLIGADYPGYAVETVKRHFGGKTIAMFAQACGGDINAQPLSSGFEAASSAGAKLGTAVIKAACESRPLEVSKLITISSTFEIPLNDFTKEEECRKRLAEIETYMNSPDAKSATAEDIGWNSDAMLCIRDLLDKIKRNEKPSLRFETNALALNDQWCLLAMSHEMLSEYQRWIEKISPFQLTMVLGYTNACESYIPADSDIAAGGPEAALWGAPLWYHHRVAPKIGMEKIIKEKVAALLSDIKNKF